MRLTRHNGRAGKDGIYNPKHNDRRFDIRNSDHIDEDRAKQNVYWDCYQGYRFGWIDYEEEKFPLSFERVEQIFYEQQYGDYCDAQHERNRKSGHSNRDRTPNDLRLDKRTCPEETIIQIGTMEKYVEPGLLAKIAAEFFEEFHRRFGEHIHILNWALHMDESTPHIQERHVFDCKNAYGEIAPQQEKALEALGFERPYPDKKKSKTNNRKVTFDAACRAILFDIALENGLHLEQEPEYGGREYLEKQDYILMKQKEKIKVQEQLIGEKEKELEDITIRIADKESFASEVADAAYEKATEVVTKIVQDETRNADFDIIDSARKSFLKDPNLTDKGRSFTNKVFESVMKKFKGMTQHITERLTEIFRRPEVKEQVVKPVKQSVLKLLDQNKAIADELNAKRKKEKGTKIQEKNKNMER